MASDKELSDLDLELLGEKPSTPAHADVRPATSSHTVQGSGKKAPTQVGFTNKSRSSVTPDRVHVFGSVSPAQGAFTIKTDHQLNEHGPVLTPKAPPKPSQYRPNLGHSSSQGNIPNPLPGRHQPIFGRPSFHYPNPNATSLPGQRRSTFSPESFEAPTVNAQGPSGVLSSMPSHPSENRPLRVPRSTLTLNTDTPNISDNSDSIMADTEDVDEGESEITKKDVIKLLRQNGLCERTKEDLSKRLSYVESENAQLKDQLSELERNSKAEMRETSKKLSATEAENAELHDKYTRAEETLRMKVEQAVKDVRRAQNTEQNLEKLKDEHETLKSAHSALTHKCKTQTNQVVGCEKKVTKAVKELTDYKAVAEAEKTRLLQANESLKRGLEDSRNFIRSNGIDVRQADTGGLGTHVDSFEDSRKDWVETQCRLEDDLAAVKAVLDEKEQKISNMEEENKRLNQAKTDLKRANQDLRKAQAVATVNKTQTSLKQDTQTDYSTDEDRSSLRKKPERSLGEELINATSSQSGDDEPPEVEEKTVTIRDFNLTSTGEAQIQTAKQETKALQKSNPTTTAEAQTQTEEQKTITLCESKSIATAEAQTQTEEQETMTSLESQPIATVDGWTQTETPKFERSPIYFIESVPITPIPAPLPIINLHSQGTQTDPRPTRSQGVQTESVATQSGATQTTSKATQSQGTQTESIPAPLANANMHSQGTQTDPRPTRSQGVQTESVAAQSKATPREPTATNSAATQTDCKTTRSQGVQTDPTATRSKATQTEAPETIVLDGNKSWYMKNYTRAILGTVLLSALFVLLFWAWSQCRAATKERNMWMLANDHAYRLSDEVIRRQAIALLQRTENRAKLGWLTPEKVMTLHRGAHQAFARKLGALVPTRSISKATLVRSAMAPTPAGTQSGVWPAWGDHL